ncbi:MAG: sensor histidine kinase [Chloroflexia bacterium]
MEALNLFFTTNRALIYFVGGLSFFSMGLASALERRRYSRLRLARHLGLLAGFGLLYGLNEWANLIIPLQERLPIPTYISWLSVLQLLARGLALALLFQFGVELLRPTSPRWRGVRFLPGLFVLFWVLALVYLWAAMRAPGEVLFSTGDVLARYLLGLPGAALSCLGLLEQRREVREAGFPHIAHYLLGAALALGFFIIVGVFLAVAGPFFPGEWLAYPWLLYAIGVLAPLFRTLDGVAMALFTGRALAVFEAETEAIVAEAERRNLLLADRERIGRELHDGIIQSLYAAGLRLEDALHTCAEAPEEAREKIRSVMGSLNQVIQEIRTYIFDLRSRSEEGSLVRRLAEMVQEVRLNTMVEADLRVHGLGCDPPPGHVAHLSRIVQEALSNVLRHARAHRVKVEVFCEPEALRLEVADDGCGFDPEQVRREGRGMGLRTMRERAEILGGTFQVASRPGSGTRVTVQVPCSCLSGRSGNEAGRRYP